MEHNILELSCKEFFNNGGKRFFYSSAFEITSRCNFKCIHCYIDENERKEEYNQQDLNFRQVCTIIDKLIDFGCLQLLLTGGEPLLRDDFLDIYLYAKKRGLIVDIFTNATLIDDRSIDCFIKYPPRTIQVSLYGMSKDIYESLTQVAGAYEITCNNIELLLKKGFNVRLAFPILALNKPDFSKIKSYTENKKIHLAYNPVIFPSLDGNTRPFSFVMPAQEVVDFDFQDSDRFNMLQRAFQNFYSENNLPSDILCRLGDSESMAMKSIVINSKGEWDVKRYFPCLPKNYNLLGRQGIRKILDIFLKELTYQREHNDCLCKKCRYLVLCGRCFNLKRINDTETWYFCKIAKEREKRFSKLKNEKQAIDNFFLSR
jgi:MoaA/NifB/PqqE/SkfB family radical SAM enzyme